MSTAKLEPQVLKNRQGQSFAVQVCRPDAQATEAVVLLPAIAGVNAYVADRAAHLVEGGYLAVVIDYFSQAAVKPDLSTPERIGAAVAAIDDRRVLDEVAQAIAWLAEQGIARDKVGVLGFCIGGTYAALAGCEQEGPACAVTYYGQLRYPERSDLKPADPIEMAPRLQAPFLGHFGDGDRLIGRDEIGQFAARLRSAQRHHEIRIYAGAPHAFDEWFRPAVFRPVASAEAWNATLTFLDWHLRQSLTCAARFIPHFQQGD